MEISPVTLTHSVTNCAIQNLQFRMLAGNRFSQDVTELDLLRPSCNRAIFRLA